MTHLQKTKKHRVKVTGNRGSWFAKASDDGRSIPVLWKHQINFRELMLETDWEENGRDRTALKRELVREYFETGGHGTKEVIIARALDPDVRPHDRKEYICCYEAEVVSTRPEIKLNLLSKAFECRK